MAKLDLDWLSVFVEIYRTSSVSRAAARLGVAQASASIALNMRRRHFGDPLFCRTSRGMEPTPRAQSLYPELAAVLDTLQRVRGDADAFDPGTAQRMFRIGMTDISEIVLLPKLLNRVRSVAPGITIEGERISAESQRRLESGEVDLAVGFMPQLESGFYQQTLFNQNFVCLVARHHPRIGGKLTRALFEAEAHILVTTSGTGHAIVERELQKAGFERHIALRLPSFLGVARIVAQTELLVVVPRLLGETLAGQEAVRMVEPPLRLPSYAVKQHWHERFHLDAGNAWLRRTVSELFSGQGQARPTPRVANLKAEKAAKSR